MTTITERLMEAARSVAKQWNFSRAEITPLSVSKDVTTQSQLILDTLTSLPEGAQAYLVSMMSDVQVASGEPAVFSSQAPVDLDEKEIYFSDGTLNAPFLMENADHLFQNREYKLAANIYETLLNAGHRSGLILYRLGVCDIESQSLQKAEKRLEEAVAYGSGKDGYLALVSVLIRLKKNRQAIEVIERALCLTSLSNEDRFELFKAQGNSFFRIGDYDRTIKSYRLALDLKIKTVDVFNNLGSVYLKTGRLNEAKDCFEKVVKQQPNHSKALTGLGCVLFCLGERRPAFEKFIQALWNDGANSTAVYYLIRCAYSLNDFAPAEPLVRRYAEMNPVNPNLLYGLAGMQCKLGRVSDAVKSARRVLELNHTHEGAKELIAAMGT